ncbi:MAG TPA: lysophospholipid acyltransferase family protein [Longimicrobiales bacterium]|nr:lysophospholipid acyltransferase family protein [Longimicrobiales bacterium]
MPIRYFVWSCVACGQQDALRAAEKAERCSACGALYQRGKGATIVVTANSTSTTYRPEKLADLLPDPGHTGSVRCTVSDWVADKRMYALGRYVGLIDHYGPERPGLLELGDTRIAFTPDEGTGFDYAISEITAVQPGSHALQIKTRRGLHSLHFVESSAYAWERRLCNALRHAHQPDEVVEVLPRVRTAKEVKGAGGRRVRRRVQKGMNLRPATPWQYRFFSWLAHFLWHRFGGGVIVHGLEHLPERGPFILVVNHQSFLETMVVPAVLPRAIYAMAKTTQFTVPFFGWLMAQVMAFPVRRFEVDAHAVDYITRRMAEGSGVMIFPEGERTWDGLVGDTRFGVSRLAMSLDIPVIPCHVSGAYEAWPRWSRYPQKHPITVTVKPALQLSDDVLETTRIIADSIRS